MNFSALKTAAETRPGSHTRTGEFINRAQLELAKESRVEEKGDITFTSGVATIPSTCLVVLSILWDGYPLEGPKPQDMYIYESSADPTQWAIKNGEIILDTQASETQTDGLLYTPRPAEMSENTDTPELADCDDALIAFARYMIYDDLEHAEKAGYWWERWLMRKSEWLALNVVQNPRPRKIKLHSSMRTW